MPMALHTEPRTRAELLALPDDGCRHELVDGEHLVTPAPSTRHEYTHSRLYAALLPHVLHHQPGDLFGCAADLMLGADEVLQPDLFLVPHVAAIPTEWDAMPRPLLVIEIISPSSARADRQLKRLRYQRAEIPFYWVVDPDQQRIDVWRPESDVGEVWHDRIVWPAPLEAPLTIDLGPIFAP